MNVLFFIIFTLFLMILQSVILPSFFWFDQCFDLLIIDILFLSLIFSHYSVVAAIIMIGCIMDSISGVPFFYHVFSYLWIYIIVFLVKQLLFKQSIVFVLVISIVSVVIQQGLLLFLIFVQHGYNTILAFNFGLLVRQVFWGFVFIPPSIWLINIFLQNWIFIAKLMKKQMAQKYKG